MRDVLRGPFSHDTASGGKQLTLNRCDVTRYLTVGPGSLVAIDSDGRTDVVFNDRWGQ